MDQIKTKIEVGGYTISEAPWSELYGISVVLDPPFIIKKKVYNEEFEVIARTTIYLTKKCVFHIDSDDPGKLHKFTGMKYKGLVNRQQDVTQVIAEFAKKFDGCTVLYSSVKGCAVHGRKLHFIDDKSLLFSTIRTTEGKSWNDTASVCKVCGVMLGQCHNKPFIETNCGRIIAEFTRIMKDEDSA